MNYKSHWNQVYATKQNQELGWFEAHPEATWKLIEKCYLDRDARILNVGCGTSTLIDLLLEKGYHNLILNDLSEIALSKLKAHIDNTYQVELTYIVDDLTQPKSLQHIQPVNLWIDRAVLHFFLDPKEQDAYFKLLRNLLVPGGYALIAVFAPNGAETCSSLPLQRYSEDMLQEKLGNTFQLKESFHDTFINPSGGERPYIYTLFQKTT